MKPIFNYKEVVATLNMFYSEDQVQLSYAHPYEYPYVISVLVDEMQLYDIRCVHDLKSMYALSCTHKPMGKRSLLCFCAK